MEWLHRQPFVLTWELSVYDFQHMAPFLSMGFIESKEISLPQVDLKMGTVMSCDISQQIFLFALDKALNSSTRFHAAGFVSLSSWLSLLNPICMALLTPPPHTHTN